MRYLTLLFLALLVAASARGQEQPRADHAEVAWLFQNSPQYLPPVQYERWYDELVAAAGTEPNTTFEALIWHAAPRNGFGCQGSRETCQGQWLDTGDIFIATRWVDDERVVKHEMLHAILGRGDHPALFRRLNLGDH